MRTWLVDTGPMVAYLDGADRVHPRVARCLEGFGGRIVTSSAVVTEAMHLLSASPSGPRLFAEFVTASGLEIHDLCRQPELDAAVGLMEKYADSPMDFADATLVLLAEGLDTDEILTLDRRGFSTFRTRRRRGFRLVLEATR